MSHSVIAFITGVNGVGKSSIIPYLTPLLPTADIHDFDERGVPTNADKNWRQQETMHWLELAKQNAKNHITTIVCGYTKPQEIHDAAQAANLEVHVCVLTADADILTKRILSRHQTPESVAELLRTTGKTVEKFTEDNIYVSTKFTSDARDLEYALLDTSALTPKQTTQALVEWLQDGQ